VYPTITRLQSQLKVVLTLFLSLKSSAFQKPVLEPLDKTKPLTDKINSMAGLTGTLFLGRQTYFNFASVKRSGNKRVKRVLQ